MKTCRKGGVGSVTLRILQEMAAAGGLFAAIGLWSMPVFAHGPLFSAGPETIWKDGKEVSLGYHEERASGAAETERGRELFLELQYGVTADWQISVELPYVWQEGDGSSSDGTGDIILGTKYQFFLQNFPGGQNKASVFGKVILPTGGDDKLPRIGSGSTDFLLGLAAGHEGRRWYAFADARYRFNGRGEGGLQKGDKLFLDLVGGVRPVLSEYDEPDTVFMLELNWERARRDRRDGVALADSGGWELFISPVVWWTYGQYALKGGVQIPIAEGLNGSQPASDYRMRLEAVYHF